MAVFGKKNQIKCWRKNSCSHPTGATLPEPEAGGREKERTNRPPVRSVACWSSACSGSPVRSAALSAQKASTVTCSFCAKKTAFIQGRYSERRVLLVCSSALPLRVSEPEGAGEFTDSPDWTVWPDWPAMAESSILFIICSQISIYSSHGVDQTHTATKQLSQLIRKELWRAKDDESHNVFF